MVQKTAWIGAPILIAMSAPTGLAVRTAVAANITLIAVARGHSYQLFSRGDRIDFATILVATIPFAKHPGPNHSSVDGCSSVAGDV
jgi:FdhD protein